MKNTILNVIRWILVLPVMLLVHVITYHVYLWLSDEPNTGFFRHLEVIMAFVVSAGISIIAASYVAPSHRKIVSTVLCTFLCTLMLIGLYVVINHYSEYGLLGVLMNVATIVGAIVGAYLIHKEVLE